MERNLEGQLLEKTLEEDLQTTLSDIHELSETNRENVKDDEESDFDSCLESDYSECESDIAVSLQDACSDL